MAELISRILGKMTAWGADDEYEETYSDDIEETAAQETPAPEPLVRERTGGRRAGKVVDIRQASSQQVIIMQPSCIEAAQEASNHLRAGRTVICNFERIDQKVAQRVIDFITGATFALEGQIHKVSPAIFVAVPRHVALLDENGGDSPESIQVAGLAR